MLETKQNEALNMMCKGSTSGKVLGRPFFAGNFCTES